MKFPIRLHSFCERSPNLESALTHVKKNDTPYGCIYGPCELIHKVVVVYSLILLYETADSPADSYGLPLQSLHRVSTAAAEMLC